MCFGGAGGTAGRTGAVFGGDTVPVVLLFDAVAPALPRLDDRFRRYQSRRFRFLALGPVTWLYVMGVAAGAAAVAGGAGCAEAGAGANRTRFAGGAGGCGIGTARTVSFFGGFRMLVRVVPAPGGAVATLGSGTGAVGGDSGVGAAACDG